MHVGACCTERDGDDGDAARGEPLGDATQLRLARLRLGQRRVHPRQVAGLLEVGMDQVDEGQRRSEHAVVVGLSAQRRAVDVDRDEWRRARGGGEERTALGQHTRQSFPAQLAQQVGVAHVQRAHRAERGLRLASTQQPLPPSSKTGSTASEVLTPDRRISSRVSMPSRAYARSSSAPFASSPTQVSTAAPTRSARSALAVLEAEPPGAVACPAKRAMASSLEGREACSSCMSTHERPAHSTPPTTPPPAASPPAAPPPAAVPPPPPVAASAPSSCSSTDASCALWLKKPGSTPAAAPSLSLKRYARARPACSGEGAEGEGGGAGN
eukprot:scaffold14647_cov60-Phaeocystis_antarctica.AAC.1